MVIRSEEVGIAVKAKSASNSIVAAINAVGDTD